MTANNDWPIVGDCGDVVAALRRNVRPSPTQVFAALGRSLRRSFTVARIEATPNQEGTQ